MENEIINDQTPEQVEAEAQEQQAHVEESVRTFSQAEVDKLMGKVRRETRAQFADYEDLKAKAAKYDEAEDAKKTELQRLTEATERATRAEARIAELEAAAAHRVLVDKVASETGVPASILNGADEDELRASADVALAWFKAKSDSAKSFPADTGGGASVPTITKESILAISDFAERSKQIAQHKELFERH